MLTDLANDIDIYVCMYYVLSLGKKNACVIDNLQVCKHMNYGHGYDYDYDYDYEYNNDQL